MIIGDKRLEYAKQEGAHPDALGNAQKAHDKELKKGGNKPKV